MLNALSLGVLGLLLGIRHALDADHVAAVTTFVTGQASVRRAWAVGALWGAGHTVTIVLAGGAIVVFRLAISPRLGLALEFVVALMLVVLGVRNLRTVLDPGGSPPGGNAAGDRARPFLVGVVHGLAGSAGVALLVLATVNGAAWAVLYLLLFGAGTVSGMLLVTLALAIPAAVAGARFGAARRWLTFASGGASVSLGLWIALELSGPAGLFSAAPAWSPR